MSFKKFSAAHSAPAKDSPGDKPKDAPAGDRAATQGPAPQPDKTAAKAAPAPKKS